MGIRIESLSVKGLGPIDSLQWAFKDINLIYGKNEQGKTFLVEYILRSLFRNAPDTRTLTESGQVVISGIGSKSLVFNPKTKEKVDDLVFNPGTGTRVDLARLCVVRGGDLSMTGDAGGTVTKSILKEYLSDQGTLDKILDRVPIVARENSLQNGTIIAGKFTGLNKNWKEAQQKVDLLQRLLEEINGEYSLGQAKKAAVELEEIKRQITHLLKVKRAYAYQLSKKVRRAEEGLAAIPEEAIVRARQAVDSVNELQQQLLRSKLRIEDLLPREKDYQWLKTAIDECEKRPEGLNETGKPLFIIMGFFSILITIIAAFIEPFISLGTGLLSLVFLFLAVKQYQASLKLKTIRQEVENIFAEYEGRFGMKVGSIVTLKSALDAVAQQHYELETLSKMFPRQETELDSAVIEKNTALMELSGGKVYDGEPALLIAEARERRSKISIERENLIIELATANIPPEEYLAEETGEVYDPTALPVLEEKCHRLRAVIADENQRLQTLKQRICDQTRDNVAIEWDTLIGNLREKYDQAVEDSKNLHAQVFSGILVTGVIADLRKQEDERIYQALGSPGIFGPIRSITSNYTGVELDGDELVVFNDLQRYYLSTMSTGAKEQVLLALRIGLASHVLDNQKMFLILDDAFQHSDWTRRERLVDQMTALSGAGWQVIYFSMDDQLRKLFDERVKPSANGRFQEFELGQ